MKSRTCRLARALLAGACAVALFGPAATAREAGRPGPLDEATVRARADALLAQMTPQEKAGQLTQYAYFKLLPPAMRREVEEAMATTGVGSLIGVSDPAEIDRLQHIALEKTRLKIPVLFSTDVVHGLRTTFPVPLGMAATWDPGLYEQVQAVAAAEAHAVGLANTFAPMVDIARDPRWGRSVEGAGEDPYLGSAMAAAQVRGFQGPYLGAPGHIMAGAKHFVGYGASLGGRDYDEANIADAELWNVYLPPFKAAVDAGTGSLMSAYMQLNGVPAAGNRWLLTDVLRKTWGFKGVVGSDDNGVNSLVNEAFAADKEDAAARAVRAGVSLEMVAPAQSAAMRMLPKALEDGKVTQAEVDDAVRWVLETKIRLGLFEHPLADHGRMAAVLSDPAHLALARVAAERSAVLLKNENALLPLDRKAIRSIAVIGPFADSAAEALGPWASPQAKGPKQSIFQGLKARLGPKVRVDYAQGATLPERVIPTIAQQLGLFGMKAVAKAPVDESAGIAAAVSLARAADVAVLVLGERTEMTGENASSSTLDLPGAQQQLLDAVVATGKPVVLLLMSARPLDLKGTRAQAILDIWYPGSAGGDAVARLLFGDANPGGKLPITWIRNAAQAPNPYNHLVSFDAAHADKRYWNESNQPVYPFGYGLSYTSFAFSNLRLDAPVHRRGEPVRVSVEVKNTGARQGDEVAQLYIHQRYGTSSRPARELKGFQRVALKPGESRTLSFTLTPDDLRYWSAATRDWVQDEAPFDVWVGGDSQAALAGSFEISDR